MNQKSLAFTVVGLAIVLGVVFWMNKSTPAPATNQQQQNTDQTNNNNQVTPPPPPSGSSSTSTGPVAINVNYSSKAVFDPEVRQVKEGQLVNLTVKSDVAGEVHLHGYNLRQDVVAGGSVIISFIADKTGRFEYEFENKEITLGVIEVYPK